MTAYEIVKAYEKKFGVRLYLPEEGLVHGTDKEFFQAAEKALEDGKPLNMVYWYGEDKGNVVE